MAESGAHETAWKRPYAPSWVDRLTRRVAMLPGPEWPYYMLLFLVQVVYVHAILWRHGRALSAMDDLASSFFVFLIPYFLWIRSRLDRTASTALRSLRPVLAVSDAEAARLGYRLTTLPARDALVTTAVVALAGVWRVAHMPSVIVDRYASSREAFALEIGPLAVLTVTTVAVCTHHAVHQLRVVAGIHRLATRIDLLRQHAVYAFSWLAAFTGMSFLLAAYAVIAVAPHVVLAHPLTRTMMSSVILIAVACFVVPVYGMHVRIAEEKDRLIAASSMRLELVLERLHQRVVDDAVGDAQGLQAQLMSLKAERDLLEALPTWPWRAETVTAFVTTLLLPSILWLMTHAFERFGL